MTFADFHAAIRAIANGQYFSTTVEVTEYRPGRTEIEWTAYVADDSCKPGKRLSAGTAEACIILVTDACGPAANAAQPDIDAIGTPETN